MILRTLSMVLVRKVPDDSGTNLSPAVFFLTRCRFLTRFEMCAMLEALGNVHCLQIVGKAQDGQYRVLVARHFDGSTRDEQVHQTIHHLTDFLDFIHSLMGS